MIEKLLLNDKSKSIALEFLREESYYNRSKRWNHKKIQILQMNR